ncbi:unnamed protein product [Blepharisma stoltei]|uniref:Nucleolar protein 56 n=1 Tax=Blepharisma stoltei TaxID=1481888 RepID=A0AAU9J8P6_9CILI|nr:unnamed protein product [Blepharisma stoltei]
MALYYLFETAAGYSLFSGEAIEEIGGVLSSIQQSIKDFKRFKKMVKLQAYYQFSSADQAQENIQAIANGLCPKDLAEFLETNLPSVTKSKCKLAVEDARLPASINEFYPKLTCVKNEMSQEVFRGIRLHFDNLVKGLSTHDLGKAQLGLAHAYSRSKVQQDIKRYDKHIIHAISLIDQLDKDINTFAMRLKEWFSWHFPELYPIIPENLTFARAVKLIKNKSLLDEESVEGLAEVVGSEDVATEIVNASKISMGGDMTDLDSDQINAFCDKVISLGEFRLRLVEYLKLRMSHIAPNLSALIGETVGARLISQAGGLSNLAKYPASTVQILGAEKALFRALKTRGNTPKYGILYHSSFIGRAGATDKGKISRFLANKCSLASRIDCFYPGSTSAFGERMNEQVEERLKYFVTGERGAPNEDVMHEVIVKLEKETKETEETEEAPKKKRKVVEKEEEEDSEGEIPVKKGKKVAEEQKKKAKKVIEESESEEEKPKKKAKKVKVVEESSEEEEKPKKKSKKSKEKSDEESEEDTKKKKKGKKDIKKRKSSE